MSYVNKKVVIRLIKNYIWKENLTELTQNHCKCIHAQTSITYVIKSSEIITLNSFGNRVSDKTIQLYMTDLANGNNLGH